jgi:hypothetical protein
MRRLLLALMLTAVLPVPAAADFADGLGAFDAGDYATAIAEWAPLAEQGDVDALVALAGLHRQGLGTRADLGKAISLYRRAALQGAPIAQVNLGDFYARGSGVERDLVQAHMWLRIAARRGQAWATARLGQISPAMTRAELAEAARLAELWRPAVGGLKPR